MVLDGSPGLFFKQRGATKTDDFKLKGFRVLVSSKLFDPQNRLPAVLQGEYTLTLSIELKLNYSVYENIASVAFASIGGGPIIAAATKVKDAK
jgi:hypothetical protein